MQWLYSLVDNFIAFSQQINLTAFWFLIILFALFALLASWVFFYYARLRPLSSVQFYPIDNTMPGYIDLCGTSEAIGKDALYSPLTHSSCSWFRYKIWEYDYHHAAYKLVRYRGGMYLLLGLKDSSGGCVVNMAGALVKPSTHRMYYADHIDARLDQMTEHYRQQRFCFEEEIIANETTVWLAGTCHHVNRDLEMTVNGNPDRVVPRVKDEYGVEWVDEVMEDRWLNSTNVALESMQKQWHGYCEQLPAGKRPILVTDDDLILDQAFLVSAEKPEFKARHIVWLYWFTGLVTLASLLVIAAMIFIRLH